MVIFDVTLTAISAAILVAAYLIHAENDELRARLNRRDELQDLLIKKYFKLDPKPSNIGVDIPVTAQDIAKNLQGRHTKPVNLRKSWVQEQAELEQQHDTKGRMHQILVENIEQLQGPLPIKE